MFALRRMLTAILILSSATLATAEIQPFVGVVTGDDVYVRSGPSKNYYDVGKVQSGTIVQVHELIYDWYAIDPPAGTYSYISKEYVKVSDDGKTGVVLGDNVRVRAPAAGGPSRSYKIQTKLDKDAVVTVIGSNEDYYKIIPPSGVVLYVAQDFVKPAPPGAIPGRPQPMPTAPTAPAAPQVHGEMATPPAAAQTPAASAPAAPAATNTTPAVGTQPAPPVAAVEPESNQAPPEQTPASPVGTAAPATATTTPDNTAPAATATETDNTQTESPAATTPATTPATATASAAPAPAAPVSSEQLLTQAEQRYAAADKLPLADQPLDDLLSTYQTLATAKDLTEQQKALIDARIEILTNRLDVREPVEQAAAETAKVEAAKAAQPKNYIAVGKLVTSTVYTGEQNAPLMYRLVDPLTGMSICYVEPIKGKNMQPLLGKTVGIVGQVRYDTGLTLKVVSASDIDILTAQPTP